MENFENTPENEKPEATVDEVGAKQDNETVKNEELALIDPKPDNEEMENKSIVGEPVVAEETEAEEDVPTLYSDKVIYTFSVLFSVLAGGILLARNLKEVDRKDGIPHVIAFSLIYTFLSAYFLNVIKLGLIGTVTLAILGSMVLNSYFWNLYIGKGITYYRKSYRKPLIIVLCILIPLFLLAIWAVSFQTQTPMEGMRIN